MQASNKSLRFVHKGLYLAKNKRTGLRDSCMEPNENNKKSCTNSETSAKLATFHPVATCYYGNAAILTFLAFYFFIIPFCIVIHYLADPGLKEEGIPRFAFRLHRSLSTRYERWASNRVISGQAEQLSIEDIAGTEWPLFGSVFYLLGTEAIQQAWEKNNSLSNVAPKVYAAGAIKAAVELVVDPGHAAWIKQHWGKDYLHRENVFYRMLLISAVTSYQKLLGDEKYLSLLRDQIETLSKELDESPYGLLDDYPGQCYPTDVVAAIAAIRRADAVLGTDHSDFIKRSVRSFKGRLVDYTGIPPYRADSTTGIIGRARGCSSQWFTVWTPQLWPEYAKQWYKSFEKYFWQKHWIAVGFREFPKDTSNIEWSQWYIDVDSGPVIAGYGLAASAFGIGAARANGRFDHAYPLTTEAIALSWPLPYGTLAWPRILSNTTHAPYIGEAAVLFALTRTPMEGSEITIGSHVPVIVYLALASYLGIGIVSVLAAFATLRRRKKQVSKKRIPLGNIQIAAWIILLTAGVAVSATYNLAAGLLLILLAQFLPRGRKKTVGENNHYCA